MPTRECGRPARTSLWHCYANQPHINQPGTASQKSYPRSCKKNAPRATKGFTGLLFPVTPPGEARVMSCADAHLGAPALPGAQVFVHGDANRLASINRERRRKRVIFTKLHVMNDHRRPRASALKFPVHPACRGKGAANESIDPPGSAGVPPAQGLGTATLDLLTSVNRAWRRKRVIGADVTRRTTIGHQGLRRCISQSPRLERQG